MTLRSSVSWTLVSPQALRINEVRQRLTTAFERALGVPPVRYEWYWIPAGEVIVYDRDDEPVVADFDTVELMAFAFP